ncbi:MAG: fumarylacetoacetate hydrolase family protein [Rhodospirillales bacterium]|nr:fumarylacetoacetate hydrolase family protein [Rhodospirillales bacterium]
MPFSTLARRFFAWDDKPINEMPDVRRPEPRELVRESGDPTVPARVEPWLLDMPLSQAPLGDPVFDEWARLSIKMAQRLLANEILADGTIVYSGPPKLKVNGKVRQTSDLAKMIWNVPETIAYLSRLVRLAPGDLIFTGTPENVAAVERGDLLEGVVAGVGTVRTRIV